MSEHTTAQSPFPGMDPYLEEAWGDLHASLLVYARNELTKVLPPDLYVRVEQSIRLESSEDPEDDESRYPDVSIVESPEGASAVAVATSVAMSKPILLSREPAPSTRKFLAIANRARGDRLVTAIELLSPGNKDSERSRLTYLTRQEHLLATGANLVEVDLVRTGGYVLAAPVDEVSTRCPGPYRACVVRNWRSDRAELYSSSVRDPLPTIGVPLRFGEEDAALQLQGLLDRAYADAEYGRQLDYTRDPVPPLGPDDAAWADALLKSKGLR